MNQRLFFFSLTLSILFSACGVAPDRARSETPVPKPLAPHFVDAFPKSGDQFARAPRQVVINFDIALDDRSTISVTRADTPIQIGARLFGPNKISMSAALPDNAGDGRYRVQFTACLPDKSCHDGQYAFSVEGKRIEKYSDLTGQSEVTIRMKDIQFAPALIRVRPGARVKWVNDDSIAHFVNSDPHPSHNAFQKLNSLEIEPGANYSFTFDQPGEWAYHCSAHVPANMFGRIIVVSRASSN